MGSTYRVTCSGERVYVAAVDWYDDNDDDDDAGREEYQLRTANTSTSASSRHTSAASSTGYMVERPRWTER